MNSTLRVQCEHESDGPKVYRHVVQSRRRCKRMVMPPATRCWQHVSSERPIARRDAML